jgi:serine/threonine protein phosphatase 1
MRRTIIIGDIHGCYDELTELLEKLALTAEDRVIAVGDLTVKGPKSQEVLELFASDSRFESVIGNHDLALVERWKDPTRNLKKHQERTYEELASDGDSHFRYLASLPYFIELEDHVIVHAGLRPAVPLDEQNPKDCTELRTLGDDRTSREGTPWYEEYDGPKKAVFGHWPSATPRVGQFAVGIDSGCVYGFELTAYLLESRELVQVKALREYQKPNR